MVPLSSKAVEELKSLFATRAVPGPWWNSEFQGGDGNEVGRFFGELNGRGLIEDQVSNNRFLGFEMSGTKKSVNYDCLTIDCWVWRGSQIQKPLAR